MRQGGEIYHFPPVDCNDPHWSKDPVTGVLQWTSCYVLREDWGYNTFYRTGIQFQKHLDREVRFLDLRSGTNYINNRTAQFTRPAIYDFVNASRSSKAAEVRRRALLADAQCTRWGV